MTNPTKDNPYLEFDKKSLEQCLRMLEYDRAGVEEIRKLCRKQHRCRIGAAVMCICGAGCGGTSACRGFQAMYDLWERDYDRRYQQIQYAIGQAKR